MNTLRKIFEKIRNSRFNGVCECGHIVSSNLPCCPHCGRSMSVHYFRNID